MKRNRSELAKLPDAWWQEPPSRLTALLTASAQGLCHREARKRLALCGRNEFKDRPKRAALLELLRRFGNPLVLILMGASVVSALTGDIASFVTIVAMIALSVTIDFVQEYRANRAAEKLRRSVQVHATALRDDKPQQVPSTHIVPGDVVLLAAGNLVPADGIVLEAKDLFVNQALLTGEAFPVQKRADALLSLTSGEVQDADNAVFMGTSVVSGTARVLVCRTGGGTAIGAIAHSLNAEPPPTAFELGTRHFGMLIMRLTALMVLFVMLVNIVLHRPLLESFLFALALAVGLTPELLPMIVTVTLAHGALRMAAKHVIVKRLAAIHNLGSMDVLCTDKTGTLTEAKIRLERHSDGAGNESERVLELAYLNSCFESGLKSPLDDAILAHEHIDVSQWQKIDEAPFDFERRRVSVLIDDGNTRLLVVKGAPEEILRLSTHAMTVDGGAGEAFDPAARQRAEKVFAELSAQGFRVLGIAFKPVARAHEHARVDDETQLVFAGFAAFLDPPKASAAKALNALTESGIAVKIVTGDSELVTQHICRELNISVTGVLTGSEIAQLDEPALRARVQNVNLFCRVNPAQKHRVILALKARGHVVGYLGDGINDAPALHAADVSVSVDSAVDVARAAAELILLRHDLHVLHDGVLEGRRTFSNIRKYIMMGTSSNFGNMFSMALGSVFLPFLPMLPAQILLNNILYDISEVPIPLDRVDAREIRTPQKLDMRFIRNFMWTIGPVSSLFDFLTFYLLLVVFQADEVLFHTGWFMESLATQVLVIFVIRTRGNPFSSIPGKALTLVSLGIVALALLLPMTALGRLIGFAPPPLSFALMLMALVPAYLCIVEGAKRWFYRRLF